MSGDEIQDQVHAIIRRAVPDDIAINNEMMLFEDVGLDSLDFVEVVMEIEEIFNVDVGDVVAENIKTVGDVVCRVRELIAS